MDHNKSLSLSQAMTEVIGYTLQEDELKTFTLIGQHIYGIDGRKIHEHKITGKPLYSYQKFIETIYSAVYRGYAASSFHRDQIRNLEEKLKEVINKQISTDWKGGLGIGDTVKLDAHYHAFLFSFRATLDHFSHGLAISFGIDCNSFRRLGKALARETRSPAEEIIAICRSYNSKFNFAVSDVDSTSLRDRAAHYEYLKPVHVIVTKDGLRLAEAKEKNPNGDNFLILSELMSARLLSLNAFIEEAYKAIIKANWPYCDPRYQPTKNL